MSGHEPTVAKIDAALAAAVPSLTAAEQRLACALYRLLAAAEPVTFEAAATAIGTLSGEVEETLRSWPAVFFDGEDRVVGFWGLALAEMPHRLRVAGAEVFAWCAWDPLFLALIVGELEVATDDPVTGDTITYRIDINGGIRDLSHPTSALSLLRPDAPWDDNVMASFCHYVLQFIDADSARRWTADHPGTFVIGLADAAALARRHSARVCGPAFSAST